jgi:shikimate kinase
MRRKNVVLTGFMGTGKTTVGKLLAEKLGYTFVDTDGLIENRTGQRVHEIFRDRGQAAFREMETAVARELAQREGIVIATGGRMMLDSANVAVLSRHGSVFCLVATPEEILARVTPEAEQRPLLAVENPTQRILELMQEREAGYSRFQQIVTSDRTPEAVVRHLIDLFQAG